MLLHCRCSFSIPIVSMHQRPVEQVFGTLVFAILQREKANKVFRKHSSRDCSQPSPWAIFHPCQAVVHPGVFVVNSSEVFHRRSSTSTISTMPSMATTSSSPSTTSILRHPRLHLHHQVLLQLAGIILVI